MAALDRPERRVGAGLPPGLQHSLLDHGGAALLTRHALHLALSTLAKIQLRIHLPAAGQQVAETKEVSYRNIEH